MPKRVDYDLVRATFATMPGRSKAARVRATAAKVGCSKPTVVRAINRVDSRRDGSNSVGGASKERKPLTLAPDHDAITSGRTLFPNTVRSPAAETVFKSGAHSAKIGATIIKGAWKGFPVYTLSLEERASCPATCSLWGTCYGNHMPFAHRFSHGKDLEWRIALEVAGLELRHPGGFVVRLHNLGDFYSWGYVDLWRTLLERHPALHVFGYTAHNDPEKDVIARTIAIMVRELWPRFAVRFSNGWAHVCTTITIEHEGGAPADAIVCPAQTGKTESCATCALCWSTTKRIAFLRH